jgi:hypothetical protein
MNKFVFYIVTIIAFPTIFALYMSYRYIYLIKPSQIGKGVRYFIGALIGIFNIIYIISKLY